MARKTFTEKAKRLLRKFLEDPELRTYIRSELSKDFADREKTEDRIEALYREIVRLREEGEKRWREWMEKYEREREEDRRRWEQYEKDREEQNKRWEEQQRINREIMEEIKNLYRRYETGIGALCARWGLRAESSFREAIKGILEEDFPVKVERYLAYDEEGEVFGRPDQVELDLIIRDGKTIVAEIKSSMSKADVYAFIRKVEFYKKKEGKEVDRLIIRSPMVEPNAEKVAKENGIEVYTYPSEL